MNPVGAIPVYDRETLKKMSSGDIDSIKAAVQEYIHTLDGMLSSAGGLYLVDYPPENRVEVIKAVRDIANCSLQEALRRVDGAPVVIRPGRTWEFDRGMGSAVKWLGTLATIEWR